MQFIKLTKTKLATGLIGLIAFGQVNALTIADIADQQRLKNIGVTTSSKVEIPEIQVLEPQKKVEKKIIKVLTTYETPEGMMSLINNQGVLMVIASGSHVNDYKVISIHDGHIVVQRHCNSNKNCGKINVKIGGGF